MPYRTLQGSCLMRLYYRSRGEARPGPPIPSPPFNGARPNLATQQPVGPQRAYGPFDGPYVGNQAVRLGVSNGRSIFETVVLRRQGNGAAGSFAISTPQLLAGHLAL
jgi:hypothetical protein